MFLTVPLFFLIIAFIAYVADEQEHRHKLELEKAKQGIFDSHNEETLKTKLEKVLICIVILAVVALAFYAFQIPSDFLEYVLSAIK